MKNKVSLIIGIFILIQVIKAQERHIWRPILINDFNIQVCFSGVVLDSMNAMFHAGGIDSKDKWHEGILKTTDRGVTWNWVIDSILFLESRTVEFKEGNIYVGGARSVLRKSEDGGKTWEKKVLSNRDYFVYQISMFDKNNGLALANSALLADTVHLFRTTDGWNTWKRVNSPLGKWFDDGRYYPDVGYINCLTPSTFVAKVRDEPLAALSSFARTTDAGATWSVIKNPTECSSLPYDSIGYFWYDFEDSLNGWAMGGKHIYAKSFADLDRVTDICISKTSDGGQTWHSFNQYALPGQGQDSTKTRQFGYLYGFVMKGFNQGLITRDFMRRLSKDGKSWIVDTAGVDNKLGWANQFIFKSHGKTLPYLVYAEIRGDMTVLRDAGEFTIGEVIEHGRAINATISPNPARGRALLGIAENSGGGVVFLYNTLGQEVQRVEFGNVTNISLDLNGLSAGCYNAVIKTKRGVAVKKIIVN